VKSKLSGEEKRQKRGGGREAGREGDATYTIGRIG